MKPEPMTDKQMLHELTAIDSETKRLPPGFKAYAKAIAYLRDKQWEEMLSKQERYGVVYEFNTPFGLHQSFHYETYNGSKPSRAVEVYAAPVMAEKQEPVGSVYINRFRGSNAMVNTDFDYFGNLPDGSHQLYAAPVDQQAEIEQLRAESEELRFLSGDLLYWVERAVSKGNANSDTEEAYERYEAWLQARAALEQK